MQYKKHFSPILQSRHFTLYVSAQGNGVLQQADSAVLS